MAENVENMIIILGKAHISWTSLPEEHSDRKIHKQTGEILLKFRVNLSDHFSTSFYRIEVLIIVSEINYLNLFTSSI